MFAANVRNMPFSLTNARRLLRASGVVRAAQALVLVAAFGTAEEIHAVPDVLAQSTPVSQSHEIGLFAAASNPRGHQSFARIINHSSVGGTVRIDAFDDAGHHQGPLTLFIGPNESAHFNSDELEEGNADKGLHGATGEGEGDWRLTLTSDIDLKVLAYMRTRGEGFLTSMQDWVPYLGPRSGFYMPIFNPGSNVNQRSLLRLSNRDAQTAVIRVEGYDDRGVSPESAVTFSLAPGASRTLTALELESGNANGLLGLLGNGAGKWRLWATSDQPHTTMMSLLASPTGHLSNLSRYNRYSYAWRSSSSAARWIVDYVPLFPSRSRWIRDGIQGFARLINHSDRSGTVQIQAFDDAGVLHGPITLEMDPDQTVHINSDDLELGNPTKGLARGTGSGRGDWWLSLDSDIPVEVLSYIRTDDGFLTSMHATVDERYECRQEFDCWYEYWIPILNPGRNTSQVSRLRLVNHDDESVMVRIEGVDDRGSASGTVHLSLPDRSARTLTAQQLESGTGTGISGRLGPASGKWQLTVSSEDNPIMVMSLLSSPTGHLTNLSGTPSDDFYNSDIEIWSLGPATVKPLEKITLVFPGGLHNRSHYTVQMDVSGTGTFKDDDVIEATGLTAQGDRVLFAAPIMQLMDNTHASGRFAARVRRDLDGHFSNTLQFSVEEIRVSGAASWYPTTIWEIIQKATATYADDKRLNADAEDMNPGQLVELAKRIGIESMFSDVVAEAFFGALFGVSVADIVDGLDTPVFLDSAETGNAQPKFTAAGNYLNGLIIRCVIDSIANDQYIEGCTQRVGPEVIDAWGTTHDEITTLAAATSNMNSFVNNAAGVLAQSWVATAASKMFTGVIRNTTWIDRSNDPDAIYGQWHYEDQGDQSVPTKRAHKENYHRLHEASGLSVERQEELNEALWREAEAIGAGSDLMEFYRSVERDRLEQAAFHEEIKAEGLSYITGDPDDVGPLDPPPRDPVGDTDPGNDESTLCIINATYGLIERLSDPDADCENLGTEQTVQGSVADVTRLYQGLGWVKLGETRVWRYGQDNLGFPPFDSGECEILVDPAIDNGYRGGTVPSIVGFLLICPPDPNDDIGGGSRPPPVRPPSDSSSGGSGGCIPPELTCHPGSPCLPRCPS